MSERDNGLLISDIAVAINKILDYTTEMSFEDYNSDSKTRDAVERNFQIIGEASARVSLDFKLKHSHIEWRIIKDFRNLIIHEYFGVDNHIVWDIVVNRLPELYEKIIAIRDSND